MNKLLTMRYGLILLGCMMLIQSCGDDKKEDKNEEDSTTPETVSATETENIDAEILYNTCKACHGENGEGNSKKSIAWRRSWTKSNGVSSPTACTT